MNCPFRTYDYYCPFQKSYISHTKTRSNFNDSLPLSVNTSEIKSNTEAIQEYLRVPIFSGKISPNILAFINENIKNDILEFKNQMESAAEENMEQLKKQEKAVIPFKISNIYSVTYNENGLLSVSILYEEYINGKNSYIRTAYNYDLKSGTSMSLKDLFKANVDYKTVLDKKIQEKIKLNSQAYFPNTLNNFKGISPYQPFYLDKNNLIIFFEFNEIAPIASEIPTIKIPLYELKGILKPQLI